MITITIEKEGITKTFYVGDKFHKFFANLLFLWLNFYSNIIDKYYELFHSENHLLNSNSHELLAAYLQVDPLELERVHDEMDDIHTLEIFLHQDTLTEYVIYNGSLVEERLAI